MPQPVRTAPRSPALRHPQAEHPGSLALVGAGLQNALIALALLHEDPEAELYVIERERSFGGNHTWSFFEADVSPQAAAWVRGLVVKSWDAYDVAFPGLTRRVHQRYCTISSDRLDGVLRAALARAPNARVLQEDVVEIEAGRVRFRSGQSISPGFIVDARGPNRDRNGPTHVQKFVGLELEVEPHSLPPVPLLMDARVIQRDGFRFLYVLPLAPDRVLVEDTYYSDEAALDREGLRAGILDYARGRGFVVRNVVREEHGILPLPVQNVAHARAEGMLVAGYQGGFFHPTTGYSFPCALRVAQHVATTWPGGIEGPALDALIAQQRRQARYCVWLNRMLFGAFEPERRFSVLERFYRLPEDTIRRFYALELTAADKARIVCGRPPRGFSAWRLYQSLGQTA